MKKKSNRIIIIDYQLGNLFSIRNALISLGWDPEISNDRNRISSADVLILPGVGAFGDAMSNLRKLDLVSPVLDYVQSGKLFMGICLGMQLLFTESTEFGNHKGLGIIEGIVVKFEHPSKKITVPQIGWNQIAQPVVSGWTDTPLRNTPEHSYMYFVHSYYTVPSAKEHVLALTDYEDIQYCSALNYKNIFATQFHPEKSGTIGVNIYSEFLKPLALKND